MNKTPDELQDLSLLVELQKFVADELAGSEGRHQFRRAFLPLTNGLGLDSPQKAEEVEAVPVIRNETRPKRPAEYVEQTDPLPPPLVTPRAVVPEAYTDTTEAAPVWKRCLAAVIDELLVLTLWVAAIAVTLKLQGAGAPRGMPEITSPLFLRFAILEFCLIWLGYFAICFGALGMTFGMWVWGLKVAFGNAKDDVTFVKRLGRSLWSFLFYAPIAPLALLMVQKNGRNLLDVLSGTKVCRA